MLSTVVKARSLESIDRPVVVKRNVELAKQQAGEIIAGAWREAEGIIASAQKKAEALLDSAKRDGYGNGLAHWNEALATAWKSRDEYIAKNEAELVQLAVRVAEKLIGEELRSSPETISTIVREALRSVRRAKSFVLQVHPADAAILDERVTALRAAAGPFREIEIAANPSLSRGDCIVESDIGIIDARLETQLKNMERALTGGTQA